MLKFEEPPYNIYLLITIFAVLVFILLFILSIFSPNIIINAQINCSELNGIVFTRECYCNLAMQLFINHSNMDCGCPEIAGDFCVLPNGTEIKLIYNKK